MSVCVNLTQAPNKKMSVKDLVKQAAAAVKEQQQQQEHGGAAFASAHGQQELRRALKQRLKKEGGLRRVTVEDKMATYSSK